MAQPSLVTLKGLPEEKDTWTGLLLLWRSLRKNWLLAAAVATATILAATFFTLGQKRIFRATGTIEIDPTPPRPLGNEVQSVVEMGTGAYLNNREYYETQYRILHSMRVAKGAVEQLGLHRDPAFIRNTPTGETPSATEPVSVEAAAEVLLSRLTIEPEKQSRLVGVAFEDANPARAQRVVQAVIDVYREQNVDIVLTSTTSAVDWLRGQSGKLKQELESSEMELHNFKKSKNILSLSLDDQSSMLRGEMSKLNDLLTELRAKREGLDARRKELAKINSDDPSDLPASELLQSTLLQTLREGYTAALRERDGLVAEGKGPHHPMTAAAEARAAITRKALLSEVKNIRGSVEHDFRATTKEVAGLQRLYNAANKRALDLNLLEIEYNRLRRSKDNTERLFSLVLDRTKESDLTRMLRVNNVRVVDEPRLPQRAIKPSVPVNLALGLAVGLLLGIGVALGREMLDRSIKTPDDIERELGVHCLGLLPAVDGSASAYSKQRRAHQPAPDPNRRPELVVHDLPTSGTAEAARAIRTNILFMSPDTPYRMLLVTSAAPVEGKTTVACCVATAMAQVGQRVLLVDCDMRRPRLHKVFEHTNTQGLTSALLDLSSLDTSIHETQVPNLSLLPCGPLPPNPAELILSESFGRVLDELRKRYDKIVIDSPPLIPVTDAAVLSTRVDATIFVVRAFSTSKEAARRAVRSLRTVGTSMVGAILNAVSSDRPGYNHYYQYYYSRQGYGSDQDEEQSPHKRDESGRAPSPPA